MPRHRTLLVLAAAAACAAPAPALAATEVDYRVTYDVTVEHRNDRAYSGGDVTSSGNTKLTSNLKGDLGTITFRDGKLVQGSAYAPVEERHTGQHDGAYQRAGYPKESTSCQPSAFVGRQGKGSIDQAFLGPLDAYQSLTIVLTDRVEPIWVCDRFGTGAPMATGKWETKAAIGSGPLDATFDIPEEARGMGKILQRVQGPNPDADGFCPGGDDNSQRCTFDWQGWVTFVKTGERRTGDEPDPSGPGAPSTPPAPTPAAPTTPPVPTPSPTPAKPPVPAHLDPLSVDQLLEPLVLTKQATLDRRGTSLAFAAGCTTGCTGTASLSTGGARIAAARPLASLRFKVPAGKPRTIRLRLPGKARAKLRRSRRATLTVTLRPATGPAKVTKLRLRVKR